MRKFKFAGVSKLNGRYTLRATNRELPVYPEILKRDKNTHINIVRLDKPMTKDQIREHLARRKDFKRPEILAVLKRDAVAAKPVKRAAVAKKSAVKKKAVAAKPIETSAAAAA